MHYFIQGIGIGVGVFLVVLGVSIVFGAFFGLLMWLHERQK